MSVCVITTGVPKVRFVPRENSVEPPFVLLALDSRQGECLVRLTPDQAADIRNRLNELTLGESISHFPRP